MSMIMLASISSIFGQSATRRAGKLGVGDPAPDFTLQMLKRHEGKDQTLEETVTLSNFFSRMPVVLIFGSYT